MSYRELTKNDFIQEGDESNHLCNRSLFYKVPSWALGKSISECFEDWVVVRRPILVSPIKVKHITLHPDEYNALKADSDTLKAILEILKSKNK